MKDDPLTLIVCLDEDQTAAGSIFIDDEQSFNYQKNLYLYKSIKFYNDTLETFNRNDKASYNTHVNVTKIIIAGLNKLPKSATFIDSANRETKIDIMVEQQNDVVIIENLGIKIADKWQIKLNSPGTRVTYSIIMLCIGFFIFMFA